MELVKGFEEKYKARKTRNGWGNGIMDFIISCVGIVIFSCFTAYHTQSLLELGTCEDETVRAKGAVMGALALYLDFINLFLILLRFFGGRDE